MRWVAGITLRLMTLTRVPGRVGAFRRVFASRPLLFGLRLISVALFLIVILSGLFGDQVPGNNFAPTFVWIV